MKSKKLVVFLSIIIIAGLFIVALKYRSIRNEREFDEAKRLYKHGEVAQAVELFARVHDRSGMKDNGIESLVYLCQGYNSLGMYDKSILYAQMLFDGVNNAGDKALALYCMGDSYSKKGDLSAASKYLNSIVSKHADSNYVDDALYELARIKKDQTQYLDARELLRLLIEQYPNSNLIKQAIKEYGSLNIALLFSPIQTECSVEYVVQPGDSLAAIAKKFNTTIDMLKKSNGLNKRSVIRPNDRLKVNKAAFSLVIDKSKNTLTLLADGKHFKVYDVGTGKMNSTPVGQFVVTNKLVNPPWYKPGGGLIPFGGKDNLLGTRWIGISLPGYGIHGTWEPDTVGKQSSAGCVRLVNSDVEELFDIVVPGVNVTIMD